MPKRRRLVPLDKEMGVPRERVADQRNGDQKPEADREGDAQHDDRRYRADCVQNAGQSARMGTDVIRPEVVKALDRHREAGANFPMKARGTSIAAIFAYAV